MDPSKACKVKDVVRVEWLDVQSKDGIDARTMRTKLHVPTTRTYGVVTFVDRDQLQMCPEWVETNEDFGPGDNDAGWIFPASMIVAVKKLAKEPALEEEVE